MKRHCRQNETKAAKKDEAISRSKVVELSEDSCPESNFGRAEKEKKKEKKLAAELLLIRRTRRITEPDSPR